MKIKGMKKLEKRINRIVKKIDETVKVELAGSDACYPYKKKIFFSILRDYESEKKFMDNLHVTYNDAPHLPIFLYVLLHEIGHINTYEKAYKEEDDNMRQNIMVKGDEEAYFNLPTEKAATAWAVDYVKRNPKKAKNIADEITYAMEKFLAKNITE
ncbi:MAG: hypothetical protein GX078_01870 [Clostridiales bacterium]|nr:hypothetical protein [Clostridiales bacterium]